MYGYWVGSGFGERKINKKRIFMNTIELWNKNVRKLWAKDYPKILSNILKNNNVKSVLDTSGGTGYPSIELAQMGWDISYADCNIDMYNFFKTKVDKAKVNIPTYLVKWQELDSKVEKKYDALLCRGNSFTYIDGHDIETYDPSRVIENMKKALSQFYKRLNKNGVLYIDLLHEDKIRKNEEIEHETICENYSQRYKIEYDEETNIRTNIETIVLFEDNSINKIVTYSYPLLEKELKQLLLEAGFSSVEKIEKEYSTITNSFLARK